MHTATPSKRRSGRWRTPLAAVLPSLLLVAACGGGGGGSTPDEGQTWKLRTNDWNPPNHPFNADGWEVFGERIDELTDGRVTIEHYPAEGLGAVSDTLTMLESGEADMASTVVAYHPEDLPLSQVTGGAGWSSAALGAQAMWELCNSEPFVSEFKAHDVVPVVCTSVSGYDLILSHGEIQAIPSSFEGKRIRATGFQAGIVSGLGASTTSDPSTELYVRMEQKQIDGLTAGWYTLPALSLAEVTSAATEGLGSWNAGLVIFLIDREGWEEFPPEIQEAMVEAGKETSLAIGKAVDEMDAQAKKDAEGRVKIYQVSDAERATVAGVVDEVVEKWVQSTGGEAGAAAEAVRGTRDIEALPVTDWAEFAYSE